MRSGQDSALSYFIDSGVLNQKSLTRTQIQFVGFGAMEAIQDQRYFKCNTCKK